MRAFAYTAFTAEGRRRTGTILADTEAHASHQLKDQGLFVSELRVRSARALGKGLTRRKRLNADMQIVFTRQMAVLLSAGLTSEAALETVRTAGSGSAVDTVAALAKAAVLDGKSLSEALDQSGAGFPPYYIASVQAGETSGDLDDVFTNLAEHLETAGLDRSQVATALVYPMFVAAVSILVCVILMTTVAPEIVRMFDGSGRPLPPLTVAMLKFSDWIAANWMLLGAGLAALGVAYSIAMRSVAFRDRRDRILLRLPLVGRLMRQNAAVQYLRTLALVLGSRHAVISAAQSAAEVLNVSRFQAEAADVTRAIREGNRLSEAMKRLSIVPPVVRQLISTGEDTANLARMTDRGAILVENALRTERKRMAALLEPLLMMVVGGGVLVIVLSVLLPIFDLQFLVAE